MNTKILIVILISFLVVASASRSENSIELFGGEAVIKPNGLYTKIYFYLHPATGRKAVIIGTAHWAEANYFKAIGRILASCDSVVNETFEVREGPELEALDAIWRDKIFDADTDKAFEAAIFHNLPYKMKKLLDLSDESAYFKSLRKGWNVGDKAWYELHDGDGWSDFFLFFRMRIKGILPRVKGEIVNSVRDLFLKTEKGAATRKDYIKLIKLFHLTHGRVLDPLYHEILGKRRDEFTFKVFDDVVSAEKPKKICIKFGAFHVRYQRRLLEERGYILQKSDELRAVSLP